MMTRCIRCGMCLVVAWVLSVPTIAVIEADPILPNKAILTGQLDYVFVGHLGEVDDEGRLFVWDATITGDINGTMKWYFTGEPNPGGPVNADLFMTYYNTRWELWIDDELALAGESTGKNVFSGHPAEADAVWNGQGIVTEACKSLNQLKGCHIYEYGPILGPFPDWQGSGVFTIIVP